MENTFANSKLVLNKRSTSLTPWSVYVTSSSESQKVLDIQDDLITIEKDLPRLTPRSLKVKPLGKLADTIHAGKDWEVFSRRSHQVLYTQIYMLSLADGFTPYM